jgi:hypothetical protein
MSWSFEIPDKANEGETITGTFTFEEMEAHFQLETMDVSDLLKEAQAKLFDARTLQIIKAVGAGKSDIQALGEEAGFGLLDLDQFDRAQDIPQTPFGGGMSTKSTSADDLEPSEQDKGELSKALMKAYKEAQASVKELTG